MQTEQTVVVTLVDQAERELPRWEAGAHIDVFVPIAATLQPRQYSLCSDPADRREWRIAIQRDPNGRGGSSYLVDELRVGDQLTVRGPRNHFGLVSSRSYLFLAGGIGITPMLPMITAAEAAGALWRMYYGGRSEHTMAFASELVQRYGNRVTLLAEDVHGLLDLRALIGAAEDAEVYCCGPSAMLDAAELVCADRGRVIHLERFSAKQRATDTRENRSFEVHLAKTGMSVDVPPDRSILEVVEEAGADVFGSCLEGVCGTCETGVLAGIPDHRDSVLDGADGDTMMICVSRSWTDRLVLDL